jgi:hypothetical protein
MDNGRQPGLTAGIASFVCAALGLVLPMLLIAILLGLIVGLPLAIAGMVLGLRAYTIGRRGSHQLSYILGLIGTVLSVVAAVRVVLPFV